ncbi:MAG: DoxX family membrane protein [Chlorobi bacterium]|nr:DoxX family membrane protein [Chlorobiota bacterium]
MPRILAHPVVCILARIVVGGIFTMYAVDKIAVPADFALNIERYELLPLALVNLMAIILPWIELLVGVFLLVGVRLRANAILAVAMLAIFILAIGSAMARGLEINCGCSAHSETVGWGKIIEDALYLLLALRIVIKPDATLTLERLATTDTPSVVVAP